MFSNSPIVQQQIVGTELIAFDKERTHSYTDWSRDCTGQPTLIVVNDYGSWDTYLALLADFAGADDITNWAKEREPGIEIIERTP